MGVLGELVGHSSLAARLLREELGQTSLVALQGASEDEEAIDHIDVAFIVDCLEGHARIFRGFETSSGCKAFVARWSAVGTMASALADKTFPAFVLETKEIVDGLNGLRSVKRWLYTMGLETLYTKFGLAMFSFAFQ